ncbi:iron-sulfur cluster carrier protein ApbC [Brackiella oedipodis]|uniref:iron-sulfur cluster carrier protein ApbC n=1 Tax=Brackiella oedipodis TaxID=124225 RepID=UPI00049202AB|nr:iron-sulfur cluster carrier protein ApbC [Brackiella oedipodis]
MENLESLVKLLQENLKDPLTNALIGQKIKVHDFQTGKKILGLIKSKRLKFKFQPGFFMSDEHKKALIEQIQNLAQQQDVELDIEIIDGVKTHVVQGGIKPLKTVKNIIAVASGKGGVGKSTTAVNLALALSKQGARVGVLDADIYGPSQPLMLGVKEGKPKVVNSKMQPWSAHGIWVNSIGFLIDGDAPAILRGPMVSQALDQLVQQTAWPDLDYLVVDMPPGTGDIALTLSQKVPVVGSVIVTTPQDVALIDARKGVLMFHKVDVPVLGLIENMSMFTCPNCGHTEHLFGHGGGRKMAQELNVPWLGDLPLTRDVREQTDSGNPTVISDPDSEAAKIYQTIAHKVALQIATLPIDHSGAFPKVVVQSV